MKLPTKLEAPASHEDADIVIGEWHAKTLNVDDDQELIFTVRDFRILLWALHRGLQTSRKNERNIDYNLNEIGKLKSQG